MLTTRDRAYFAAVRRREFARLDRSGVAYLDYAGAALHAASHVDAHRRWLDASLYGNPHSEHTASRASTTAIERGRAATLAFLGVSAATHDVCFTANTSAAIKIVAESFPFSPERGLVLAADNHNSMNGLREYARRAAAPITTLPLDQDLRLDAPMDRLGAMRLDGTLVGYPAQSNFSGVRHPLELVRRARARGATVLLDAAAFLPTCRLDLSTCAADFVVLSFYKLFGYPTGLGALVARREALRALSRPWFAGGTVDYVSIQLERHQLRDGSAGFEDGTPDFLGALAIPAGFALLDRIGPDRLARRMRTLTSQLLDGLGRLRTPDGQPRVRIYGPATVDRRGGIVAFNLLHRRRVIPYWRVEGPARRAGIALRGGCFCNPGAAEVAFGIDAADSARCLDACDRFSVPRFAKCLGHEKAIGALRISLGLATSEADIDRALGFLAGPSSR